MRPWVGKTYWNGRSAAKLHARGLSAYVATSKWTFRGLTLCQPRGGWTYPGPFQSNRAGPASFFMACESWGCLSSTFWQDIPVFASTFALHLSRSTHCGLPREIWIRILIRCFKRIKINDVEDDKSRSDFVTLLIMAYLYVLLNRYLEFLRVSWLFALSVLRFSFLEPNSHPTFCGVSSLGILIEWTTPAII